jgi:2-polyprenyl-6-methoxyphenol hydroxylase-like FAD-dependent oxidoreductase
MEELAPHTTPFGSRVVLVGEAAHAPLQEAWQNLSLDLEDAAALSTLLGGLDREAAFRAYGQLRYPRSKLVFTLAHEDAKQAVATSKFMSALRDMAARYVATKPCSRTSKYECPARAHTVSFCFHH